MPPLARPSAHRLVAVQVSLVLATIVTFALLPPTRGKMILVPLRLGGEPAMLPLAIGSGAMLVGAGPLPHSFVVDGDRAALAARMFPRGVLVLAAPPAGCGARGGAA